MHTQLCAPVHVDTDMDTYRTFIWSKQLVLSRCNIQKLTYTHPKGIKNYVTPEFKSG